LHNPTFDGKILWISGHGNRLTSFFRHEILKSKRNYFNSAL